LIKEYVSEVRRRQASVRYASDEDFEIAMDEMFTKNNELFQKLAEFEAKERTQK